MADQSEDYIFGLVRSGYDKIARTYTTQRKRFDNFQQIDKFVSLLPPNAKVLDAGCGTGDPVAMYLDNQTIKVVGVDMSATMISLAKENLPACEFHQMNMTAMDFPPESFDGLISCYAVFHVPRDQHEALFRSFGAILKPGGALLLSVGASDWEKVEDFYGTAMFWSHFEPKTTQALITQAGFKIKTSRNIQSGGELHHWILAQKR